MTAPATFRLVIEDDRQAVWMAMNNTFTMPWKPGDKDIVMADHGFLLQLGKAKRRGDGYLMNEIQAVTLTDRAGTIVYTITSAQLQDPNKTWWINVAQNKRPMEYGHLQELGVLGRPPSSLHNHFTPFPGGITVWPTGGLTIRMGHGAEPYHVAYEFEMDQPVTVEIYEISQNDPLLYTTSAAGELIIEKVPEGGKKPPPGETENPPQYP